MSSGRKASSRELLLFRASQTALAFGAFTWLSLFAVVHAAAPVQAGKTQKARTPEACRMVDAHSWLTGSGNQTRSVLIAAHRVCGDMQPKYVSLTPADVAYLKDKLEATDSTIHYFQMNPSHGDCMHRIIDATNLPADDRTHMEDHLLILLLVDAKSSGRTVVGPLDNCPPKEIGPEIPPPAHQ